MITPPFSQATFRANVIAKIRNLVFRRVENVTLAGDDVECRWYTPIDDEEMYEIVKPRVFTKDEMDRHVERHVSRYSLTTTPNAIRNDKYHGTPIFASSYRFAGVNHITLELTKTGTTLIPNAGDLVCGFVAPSNGEPGRLPSFTKWFICSEQFLRMWTMIMFDEHKSFPEGTEAELRSFMFRGNHLCTANYYKWLRTQKMNDVTPTDDEIAKRYFHYHTEFASSTPGLCHVYAALVVMARYGETLETHNIPQTHGKGDLKCLKWIVSSDYEKLAIAYFDDPS